MVGGGRHREGEAMVGGGYVSGLVNNSDFFPLLEYAYTDDLLRLDSCRRQGSTRMLPMSRSRASPLEWKAWQAALAEHPDRALAEYLWRSIRDGFRIGFNYGRHSLRSSSGNMQSARDHPEVVNEYLAQECMEGRVRGPLSAEERTGIQVSRFGVIPKGKSGKWRLIIDLSSPEGKSVNDGIDQDLCAMTYSSVDDAVREVLRVGRGAHLAKVDIKQAYRMVPVHPDDQPLLGMMWEGAWYVDTALPFGLRSAPKIFSAIADALEWQVRREGVQAILHYLDDFLLVEPSAGEGEVALQKLLSVFARMKVPVAPEKLEGPATRLKFLGIILDTETLSLHLPQEKLAELRMLVANWLGRRFATVKELESLVGKLQHAATVVRPGRSFMRRLFELLKGARRNQRWVRLNVAARSDLMWWHTFMTRWNGAAMMSDPSRWEVGPRLYSDASGRFGCGAWWSTQWFQLPWPQGNKLSSIAEQELLPIVLACFVWGSRWRGMCVTCYCDNMAVVEVVNSGYSKDGNLAQLLRVLFFAKAYWDLELRARHIPGLQNGWADAISRNNLNLFLSQASGMDRQPTHIPPRLVELLVQTQPDWMSPAWSRLFTSSLRQDWPHLPEEPTSLGQGDTSTSVREQAAPPSQFKRGC